MPVNGHSRRTGIGLGAPLSTDGSAGNRRSSPEGSAHRHSEAHPPDCVARLALYKRALQGKAHGGLYVRRRSNVGPMLRGSVPAKVTLLTLQRSTYYELFDLRCVEGPSTLSFPTRCLTARTLCHLTHCPGSLTLPQLACCLPSPNTP